MQHAFLFGEIHAVYAVELSVYRRVRWDGHVWYLWWVFDLSAGRRRRIMCHVPCPKIRQKIRRRMRRIEWSERGI